MGILLTGMAEVDITPYSNGYELGGYAPRNSTGIHDHIEVVALVIDDFTQKSVICTVDVSGLTKALTDCIKERVEVSLSIPRSKIIIAATHTHSAPKIASDKQLNQDWVIQLENKIFESIVLAHNNRQRSRLGTGCGNVSGIGLNRRNPEHGIVDNEFKVVKITDIKGNITGLLVNYACHATTLGMENTLITADYPGAVRDYIKNHLSDDIPIMFLNGACGDINPGGYSAEESAMGKIFSHRNFSQMAIYGEILGKKLIKTVNRISAEVPKKIQSGSVNVKLRVKELPLPEQAVKATLSAKDRLAEIQASNPSDAEFRQAWMDNYFATSEADFAQMVHQYHPDGIITHIIQGIAIGDTLLIAFQGELFTEIGLEIKVASPFKHTLVIGYASGENIYIPTAKALREEQGYEVRESLFTPEAIERLIAKGKELACQINC